MEANPVSENRKRPWSSLIQTTFGIFTSINGSDTVQLDSTCRTNPEPELRRPESPLKRPASRFLDPGLPGKDVLLNDLVKDLRSRRVFSPSSKEISDQKLGAAKFGCDESEVDDDAKKAKHEGLENESSFSCLNGNIDEKKTMESEQIGKVDNGSGDSKMIEGLNEQVVRTTPPDAKRSVDSGVGEKCGNGMESSVEKPSNGNSQNIESDSKNKVYLKPCSRRKVFKTPGSVSYRRLLPYLMDISKENSCELEIDPLPKLNKGLEEKKPQATKASQSEEVLKDNVEKGGVSMECLQNGHPDAMQKTVIDCATESFNGHELKLKSSEDVTESPSLSTEADKSWSKSLVNGHMQNFDVGLSSEDQKLTSLECHMPIVMEHLQGGKDNVIDSSSDDGKLVGNVNTRETDSGFPCKVLDGDISNSELSSSADGSNLGTDNELGQYSEDLGQPGCEGMENPDVVHPSEDQKINQMNDQRGGDDCEVEKQVDHLSEESIQMTPPDAEIFGKPEAEGSGVDRVDFILQNKDYRFGKPADEINHRNASLDYNTRHNSNAKSRGVSKPRSQLKLFRSPGSFSYRRMLPFLMDMAKDGSDALVNGQCTKTQTDLEKPSPLASDNQGIPLDKSHGSGFEENKKDDSALPLTLQTAVNDSSKDEPNLISPEHCSDFQTSFNSQKEESESLQVNEIISGALSELDTSPDLLSSPQDPGRPVVSLDSSNCESSSSDELAMSNSNQLSVKTEGDSPRLAIDSSDVVKAVEADNPCYTSSQHEVLVSSENPAGRLKKGILKRNPRGCRGLCTCLNCASFRLHAERAYEFSKNQMEDAQEVVTELIKELSYLRNVLEKSAKVADDQIVVQASQAKEACGKASEAEELAKNRISEMNYDLNIHCRITCLERPRVRFANGVKGNRISKTNSPSEQVPKNEEDAQRELQTR